MNNSLDFEDKNLKIFSWEKEYMELLKLFNVIEKWHFEYKWLDPDGRHKRWEYFINFRLLNTSQEIALTPYYHKAIEEFFKDKIKDMIIVWIAYGSLSLAKVIQTLWYEKYSMEYAYAEKRNWVLGIFDDQAKKCQWKHLLFIEDVCNNGTSLKQLNNAINEIKDSLNIKWYSIIYWVHRWHTFLEEPKWEIYAMSLLYAPAYNPDDIPEYLKNIPLKEYKK
jgi:orotate phosphoribosyltransferase